MLENGKNDEVLDNFAIVINTEEGIIVIAGCSYSGICNIVEYAKEVILAHCTANEVGDKFIEKLQGNIKVIVTEVGKECIF